MKTELHKIRVNVKSLAAEARFIRHEIRKSGKNVEAKSALQFHLANRVKPEARLAHLALAFIKGVPYAAAEQSTKRPVSSIELYRKISKFVYHAIPTSDVADWLAGKSLKDKAA